MSSGASRLRPPSPALWRGRGREAGQTPARTRVAARRLWPSPRPERTLGTCRGSAGAARTHVSNARGPRGRLAGRVRPSAAERPSRRARNEQRLLRSAEPGACVSSGGGSSSRTRALRRPCPRKPLCARFCSAVGRRPGRLAAWPAPRRLGQVDNQRPLRTQTSLARPRAPAPPRPFPGELRRAQLPPCALATGVAHLRQALPAPGRREEHAISRAGSARGRAGSGPRPRPPQHRGPPPRQTVSGLETRAPLTTQPPRSGAGSVLARPRGLRPQRAPKP